ncbi:MAG: hypothetical protein QOH67_4651 [Hyphomicrobiales bacterium]|jgi:hypothetical protein|nr:hypothetical protein [Hyphomicrobiales bacterium]
MQVIERSTSSSSASKVLFYVYIAGMAGLYVFVKGHTPLTLYATAPHDDTLFMRLGALLASGRWLGPYDQFTLMKGPGFPAFLAITSWLGLSISLTTALLHTAGVVSLTLVSRPFVKSALISMLLFTLLLWHPLSLALFLTRILRDSIYYAQALLGFAALVGALFYTEQLTRRLWLGAFAGAIFGWFWLTREEGVWVLPPLTLLLLGSVIHAFSAKRVRDLVLALLTVLAVFAATQVAFRTMNWLMYGYYVGVDFKEPQYQRALRAIHSVRGGGVEPSISVTKANREAIYKVSPAFTQLKSHLDGRLGEAWAGVSCSVIKMSCTEIGVGWFIFALRDGVWALGYYRSPAEAARFYKAIADEIDTACDRGELVCLAQPIPESPPLTWAIVKDNLKLSTFVNTAQMLLLIDPPGVLNGSSADDQLVKYLKFLNYPPYERTAARNLYFYTLSGWYFRGNADWMTVSVQDIDGSQVGVRVDRNQSPDLVAAFKAEEASQQRFTIKTRCSDECILHLQAPDGGMTERKLGEFKDRVLVVPLGSGSFAVDGTTVSEAFVIAPSPPEKAANWIRLRVLKYYQYAFLPVLALGGLLFVVTTLVFWRIALWNVCYVLALVCWGLALSRAMLLIVMAVTTSTTVVISHLYIAPAFFFLVCGAVYSIGAAVQLFASRRSVVAAAA